MRDVIIHKVNGFLLPNRIIDETGNMRYQITGGTIYEQKAEKNTVRSSHGRSGDGSLRNKRFRGRILGKNVNSVYTLLNRSRQLLREKLGGDEYE